MDDAIVMNCPLCHKHCRLDDPKCRKGVEFAKHQGLTAAPTIIEEKKRTYDRSDDPENTPEEKLTRQLRRCAHFLRHHSDDKGSQRRVMRILREKGVLSQREMMNITDVRSGSISELVSKIEAKGFIERRKNKQDKRHVEICLTDSGNTALDEMQARYQAAVSDLFAPLSDDEKTQLSTLLDKLLVNWDSKRSNSIVPCAEGDKHHRKHHGHEHHHGDGHHKGHEHHHDDEHLRGHHQG